MNASPSPISVLEAYCSEPSGWTVTQLGDGNINDTYLVKSGDRAFVLQRINGTVFPYPQRIIRNFEQITAHLSSERSSSLPLVKAAFPIKALNGSSHYVDEEGDFWRAQTYIPHRSKQVISKHCEARSVGRILAAFHSQLSDFDGAGLQDPLPGFHDLPLYLGAFDTVCRKTTRKVDEDLGCCLDIVINYRGRGATLKRAGDEGILTYQPVHGDPKLDNFLFNDRDECFGVLDLDTVAMGLVHHDLGDCLRSCCNRAGEAGGRNCQVVFDLPTCAAMLDGYFSVVQGMDKKQRHYIFDAILLICFELGVRFLTDYLEGNLYFKVQREDDNLFKAVKQFRLMQDIDRKENSIRHLIESIASGTR